MLQMEECNPSIACCLMRLERLSINGLRNQINMHAMYLYKTDTELYDASDDCRTRRGRSLAVRLVSEGNSDSGINRHRELPLLGR